MASKPAFLKPSTSKDADDEQLKSTAVKHYRIPRKEKEPEADDQTVAAVKHYKIPRKDKEQNKNVLQEITFNSREYSQDIYPIIKQNYYQRNDSEKNFRYIHCYLVQNPELSSKMEARKKEMKNNKIYTYSDKDLNVSYGFLEVLSVAQAESICKEGLHCGHRTFGSLGQPKLGVYLSRYSDVLTAAPLTSGVSGTFIIFKMIKGRIKLVPFQSGHLEPTPNFDCHIIKSLPNDISTASSNRLFECLQIYLYEYDETELVTEIRQICPMAVLTYDYGPPSARSKDHILWTGSITCGDKFAVHRIQMLSQFGKMKPYSLGKSLPIKKLTSYTATAQWQPIAELRTDQMQMNLHRRRELRLNNGMYVSVFRFSQDRNEEFTSFVKKLANNNAVALSSLRGGTFIVMFSLGELSDQVGIPRYCDTFLSLHCLIVSYRSVVAGLDFGRDPYDLPNLTSAAPAGYRVNPVRLELLCMSMQPSADEVTPQSSPPQTATLSEAEPVKDKDVEMVPVTEKQALPVEKPPPQPTSQSIQPPQTIVTQPNPLNLAAAARDPRIIKKVAPLVLPQKQPLLEAPRPLADMELCSPDSPEPEEGCQLSPLSIVRRETGVNASDLSFITIEDTPSSPGPQENEEKHEVYRPPVIVPLESVKQSYQSKIRKTMLSNKNPFHWPEAAKKSLDEIASRSPAVSMSSAEKAIISLATLRPLSNLVASSSSSTVPRPISERQSTSSAADESDDRLVIAESSSNRTPTPKSNETFLKPVVEPPPNPSVISLGDGIYLDAGPEEEEERVPEVFKGILIPDDLIFLKTAAEEAELILQSFQQMKDSGEAEWSLKVHSQMVLKLADSKKNLDPNSLPHERVTKLLVLLTRYRTMGTVELLSRHECDVKSRAAKDYLPCLIKIKQENPTAFCVFLSNLSPDSDGAKEFLKSGISVLNVASFIEKFLKHKT